jgi:hypothetical protein
MNVNTLTPAMLRELRAFEFDGNPSDPCEWQHAPESLWFHARDRVIGALLRRGLIADDRGGYAVTDAGRAALAKALAKVDA